MEFRYLYIFPLKIRYELLKELGLRSLLYPSEKSADYIIRRLPLILCNNEIELLSRCGIKISYSSTKAYYYVSSYTCTAMDALKIITNIAPYYD